MTSFSTFWVVFKEEITEPLQLLLLGLVVCYFIFGAMEEAITALVVILSAVLLEVFNEFRAKRAVDTLAQQNAKDRFSRVLRAGKMLRVLSAELVVGDVLLLETPGERVGADARLITNLALETHDVLLTGENEPIRKDASVVFDINTPLALRSNMVFADTAVVRGRASAVVTHVGFQSESGAIRQAVNRKKK